MKRLLGLLAILASLLASQISFAPSAGATVVQTYRDYETTAAWTFELAVDHHSNGVYAFTVNKYYRFSGAFHSTVVAGQSYDFVCWTLGIDNPGQSNAQAWVANLANYAYDEPEQSCQGFILNWNNCNTSYVWLESGGFRGRTAGLTDCPWSVATGNYSYAVGVQQICWQWMDCRWYLPYQGP